MATEIWVNIGSGNGLLPDGTKPLPEPILTYHHFMVHFMVAREIALLLWTGCQGTQINNCLET